MNSIRITHYKEKDPSAWREQKTWLLRGKPPGKGKTQIMQGAPDKTTGKSLDKWLQTGSR